MSGYIKLFRGWRDTDGLLPSDRFSDCEAWLWLLENCAFKELSRWNGKGEEIRLQPGQIHVSIRSLTTAWGWSRKAVTTFLARLERVQKVSLSKGQSGTVLTVCNWGKYQSSGDGQGDSLEASKGTAGGQPGDTQEEGKEGKENNNGNFAFFGRVIRLNLSDFRNWQNAYPDLDIRALLTGRDAWLTERPDAERKKWFISTASWLANKQQEAKRRPDEDPMANFIC